MIDVSIIIVSWNVKNLLRDCLNSIYKETERISFELIVADNASSDGSAEMVRTEFPQVILINSKENVGFNRANNQAIRISQGEYILLLNPDTVILDVAVEKLHNFIEQQGDIVGIGPMILNSDGKTIQFDCARKMLSPWREFCFLSELNLHFKKSRLFSYITLDYWDHKDSCYIDLLSGACMLCKTNIIREIGLLDEDYFMYADDVDLCYRIGQKGKIYYLADAKIIHYGGESSKQISNDLWLMRIESTRLFFRKNKGFFFGVGYKTLVLLSQLIRILLILSASIRNPSPPLKQRLLPCWKLILWGIKLKKAT